MAEVFWGSTPGCDVDFVQGTDSFRFGVWLDSLWRNGCCAHARVEVGKDSRLRSHLRWIGIVESPMCICSRDYPTVDHVLWGCFRKVVLFSWTNLVFKMLFRKIQYPVLALLIFGH
jgi:hypothetical protein